MSSTIHFRCLRRTARCRKIRVFDNAAPSAMHINPERSTRPDYDLLVRQVASVLEGETDLTANAAQFAALVYDTIADLNWAGFYFTVPAKGSAAHDLLVGPFQGKPACARIPFGRGVC